MRWTIALLLLTTALAGCIGDSGGDDLSKNAAGAAGSFFSDTHVFEGNYDLDTPRVLERGPYDILSQETHLVPSELDGADIMIFVVRPDVPEGTQVPVILDAGPYFPPMHGLELDEDSFVPYNFVSNGYAFAALSVRGTGDSGGCMDLMGPMERHDIDQGVTWLGTQAWSNGNVGMFGGSYDGSTQWTAASTGNPHLKTIVPLAAIPSLFHHQVYNGTVQAWTPAQFAALYWFAYGPLSYNPVNGRSAENTVAQVVCPESAEATAISTTTLATGDMDPLGFWAERDYRDEVLANYNGTVYMVQGFADVTVEPHNAYPFTTQLEDKGVVVKHTLGPWGHELPWRADSIEILVHWYDRWLKEDPSVDIGPKAQVMDNAGLWRSEEAWPPADATPMTLQLTSDGALTHEPAAAGSMMVTASVPVQQPTDLLFGLNSWWKLWEHPEAELCASCPVLTTGPVGEDLRFAGMPRLHLAVTPHGPGGHITAQLFVKDGEAYTRVGYGQMDLRFHEGDGEAHQVTPGERIVAKLGLEPLDAVVPAGSELVLLLTQGSYGVRIPSAPTYPVEVHTGDGASTLVLDTFERVPEDFHDAPARVGPDTPPR